MISLYVFWHQVYQYKKFLPIVLTSAVVFALPLVTWLVAQEANRLAQKPLQDLNTEIIIQFDENNRKPRSTRGLIEPFNLRSFDRDQLANQIRSEPEVKNVSTALLLWQLSNRGTLTFAGIDTSEPNIGLRNFSHLLTDKSTQFSGPTAREVLLELHYARLFGFEKGGQIELGGEEFVILDLIDFQEDSNINSVSGYIPYGTALSLSNLPPGSVNQMFVELREGGDVPKISGQIATDLNATVVTKDSLYQNLSAYNQFVVKAGVIALWVLLPASLLLFIWLLKLYQKENQPYVKTLKLIGWPRHLVMSWLANEALMLLVLASVLAIGLAFATYGVLVANLEVQVTLNRGLNL